MASLASLITNTVNALYGKVGETKTVTPLDFMPDWSGKRKQKETDQNELKNKLLYFAKQHNKKIEREKKLNNKPPIKRKAK